MEESLPIKDSADKAAERCEKAEWRFMYGFRVPDPKGVKADFMLLPTGILKYGGIDAR